MQEEVLERQLKLFHFARLANLKNILEKGLIPRKVFEDNPFIYPPQFNDPNRHDRQRSANCLSIGHPNYKMFYPLRCNNPNVEWVVLRLKRKILWEKDCAFCITNAANSNIANIPIEKRKGLKALKSMFEEMDGKPSRGQMNLPKSYPTDPQAEVLVFGTIEPTYIREIFCQTPDILVKARALSSTFDCLVERSVFFPRHDHKHW